MKATRMHENNPGGANMNKTAFRKGINLLFMSICSLPKPADYAGACRGNGIR